MKSFRTQDDGNHLPKYAPLSIAQVACGMGLDLTTKPVVVILQLLAHLSFQQPCRAIALFLQTIFHPFLGIGLEVCPLLELMALGLKYVSMKVGLKVLRCLSRALLPPE
jgi:hypothetical protein